jgi:hypothetical protein
MPIQFDFSDFHWKGGPVSIGGHQMTLSMTCDNALGVFTLTGTWTTHGTVTDQVADPPSTTLPAVFSNWNWPIMGAQCGGSITWVVEP